MDRPEKWLRGLTTGEREACKWLAREFHVKVLRFLVGLTGDLELAEDLAQETAMQIWAADSPDILCQARGQHQHPLFAYFSPFDNPFLLPLY